MRGIHRAVLRFLASVLIAWAILEPFNSWRFRPDLLEYSIPYQLSLESGHLALTIVIFLILWLRTLPFTPLELPQHEEPVLSAVSDSRTSDTVAIPSGSVRTFPEATRREAAAALDLDWSSRFARDDEAWEAAYEEALLRSARGR